MRHYIIVLQCKYICIVAIGENLGCRRRSWCSSWCCRLKWCEEKGEKLFCKNSIGCIWRMEGIPKHKLMALSADFWVWQAQTSNTGVYVATWRVWNLKTCKIVNQKHLSCTARKKIPHDFILTKWGEIFSSWEIIVWQSLLDKLLTMIIWFAASLNGWKKLIFWGNEKKMVES